VVLTRDEVHKIFAHVHGTARLMAGLLYGSGLRLMECVRLRVKDVDFGYARITVRDAKGGKDRVTMRENFEMRSANGAGSMFFLQRGSLPTRVQCRTMARR
jgi:integrase